jgi:hypothetical protein
MKLLLEQLKSSIYQGSGKIWIKYLITEDMQANAFPKLTQRTSCNRDSPIYSMRLETEYK